jgi:mono/diheme cytochrome c family protein
MSNHNPELKPPHVPSPSEAIQPDAPDFVETPDFPAIVDDHQRVPAWLYIICGLFLFLAGSSFTGFNTFGLGLLDQGPGGVPLAASLGTQAAEPTDPMTLGGKVYRNNCASCHQPDGNGQPGKVPPLAGSEWVMGSKPRLAAIILHGLSGNVTVKGATYGTQVMTPWASILTDDQIANVMTYIRGTPSFGNAVGPVTSAEVTAAKAKFAAQGGTPYSEADLLKIAPHGPDPTDKK